MPQSVLPLQDTHALWPACSGISHQGVQHSAPLGLDSVFIRKIFDWVIFSIRYAVLSGKLSLTLDRHLLNTHHVPCQMLCLMLGTKGPGCPLSNSSLPLDFTAAAPHNDSTLILLKNDPVTIRSHKGHI